MRQLPIKRFLKNNIQKIFMNDIDSNDQISYRDLYYLSQNLQYIFKSQKIDNKNEFLVKLEPNILLASIFLSLTFFNYKIIPVDSSKFRILKKENRNSISVENDKAHVIYYLNKKKKYLVLNFRKLTKKNSIELPYEQRSLILNHSSGTTGKPKLIIQNINNYLTNGLNFAQENLLNKSSKFLNILPLNYMGGFYNTLIISLLCGGQVVLGSSFSALNILNFWKLVNKYKINTAWLTPNALSLILKANENKKIKNLYLRKCLVGMDTLSNELKKNFEKKFKTKIFESYGMTETTFISCQSPIKKTYGNVGKLIKGVKIKIKKSRKKSKVFFGEIFVKSPYLSTSIIKNKSAWFNTGDIGKINNDKSLSLIGRKKEIIIKNGINLNHSFIENYYRKLKFIKNCALIGLPNIKNYNQVKTILVYSLRKKFPKKYHSMLSNYGENILNSFETPDFFLKTDSIPTTSSGKIKKKFLNEKLKRKFKFYEKT